MHRFPPHLLRGYNSFLEGRFETERLRYRQLAEHGQSPPTMIIACCDSRAGPETIFDSRPGEMFVVRNIANLVPPFEPDGGHHGTSAAIEYGVTSLSVRNVVVLGHGRCGGIHAALDSVDAPGPTDGFVGKWMEMIRPLAHEIGDDDTLAPAERQTALERASVARSLEHLRTFPYIREREDAGTLALHGAWFDISTGELWVMDAATGTFHRPV